MSLIGFLICFVSSLYAPVFAEETKIKVLVCPEGCGPWQVDLAMSELLKASGAKFKYTPVATNGYLDNLNQFGSDPSLWKSAIFANNDDTMSFVPKGGTHPFTEFIPSAVNEQFKLLYGFYWGVTGHFFITTNRQIKKIAELKGKRIGLGIKGQSDWGMNPTLDLEYGYGITKDNSDLKYLGPKKLAAALYAGEVDAIVAALGTDTTGESWLPSSIFKQLRKGGKVYYLGHSADKIAQIESRLDAKYIPLTIPSYTLPFQKQAINTFADRDYKFAHHTFPEKLAYELVIRAAEYGPKLLYKGKWKTWSAEMMVGGLSEKNAHPGAIRAFKELGWWDKRTNSAAVNLPNSTKTTE